MARQAPAIGPLEGNLNGRLHCRNHNEPARAGYSQSSRLANTINLLLHLAHKQENLIRDIIDGMLAKVGPSEYNTGHRTRPMKQTSGNGNTYVV